MDGQCFKTLPINSFKWVNDVSTFNERFIKNDNENSDIGYFLEVDVEHAKNYLVFIKIYLFYLKEKNRKRKKLVCAIEDEEKYVIHIRALKQALNNELRLKEVHRVIQFNQEVWLKPYIDMNSKVKKRSKK